MKKIFLKLFIVLLAFSAQFSIEAQQYSSFHSTKATFNHVPQQLQPIVAKMLKLPEAQDLLNRVNQQGSVTIIIDNQSSGEFDALWDGGERIIRLNSYRHSTEGSWICSILFELHNASTNQHMSNLYQAAAQNRMTKEQWVEQMERMEHSNARKTCELIEKGIAQGIYPQETRWSIFYSFDDHYKLQQITGHSTWLANSYEQTNTFSPHQPFRGTIPGVNTMSAEDLKDFQNYLAVKNELETPNGANASFSKSWLTKEFGRLKACSEGRLRSGCFRTKEKMHLLNLAFNGNTDFEQLQTTQTSIE